jgi:hypothetical protein
MPQQARAKVRGQTEPLRAQAMSLSMDVLLCEVVSVCGFHCSVGLMEGCLHSILGYAHRPHFRDSCTGCLHTKRWRSQYALLAMWGLRASAV